MTISTRRLQKDVRRAWDAFALGASQENDRSPVPCISGDCSGAQLVRGPSGEGPKVCSISSYSLLVTCGGKEPARRGLILSSGREG